MVALGAIALIGVFALGFTYMIIRYLRDNRGVLPGQDRKRLDDLEKRFDRDYR